MIRIDAVWLAVEPIDMRAGADGLLARVVQAFGAARMSMGSTASHKLSMRITAAARASSPRTRRLRCSASSA